MEFNVISIFEVLHRMYLGEVNLIMKNWSNFLYFLVGGNAILKEIR